MIRNFTIFRKKKHSQKNEKVSILVFLSFGSENQLSLFHTANKNWVAISPTIRIQVVSSMCVCMWESFFFTQSRKSRLVVKWTRFVWLILMILSMVLAMALKKRQKKNKFRKFVTLRNGMNSLKIEQHLINFGTKLETFAPEEHHIFQKRDIYMVMWCLSWKQGFWTFYFFCAIVIKCRSSVDWFRERKKKRFRA